MSRAYYDAMLLNAYLKKEREKENRKQATQDIDSALIGGVVGLASDSALLGTAAGALLGGSLAGGILGSVAGDFLNGGLLDD